MINEAKEHYAIHKSIRVDGEGHSCLQRSFMGGCPIQEGILNFCYEHPLINPLGLFRVIVAPLACGREQDPLPTWANPIAVRPVTREHHRAEPAANGPRSSAGSRPGGTQGPKKRSRSEGFLAAQHIYLESLPKIKGSWTHF